MTAMVDPLTDAYLLEIARHFASLDIPYPPPQPAQASAPVLQRGAALARDGDPARQVPACVSCHGDALTGVWPNVPGLLGLPRDYLNIQLGAWKAGQRQAHAPDCMAQLVRRLQDDELAAITAWLAAQPLPADPRAVRRTPVRAPGQASIACGSAPELGGGALEHLQDAFAGCRVGAGRFGWAGLVAGRVRPRQPGRCDLAGGPCATADRARRLPGPGRQLHGLPHAARGCTLYRWAADRDAVWHRLCRQFHARCADQHRVLVRGAFLARAAPRPLA